MKTWAVVTGRKRFDFEVQIMVHSEAQAKREVKDLKKMGCEDARFKVFETEQAAYDWADTQA